MISVLAWIGGRARWVLLIGAFTGLAFPSWATLLRPFLPWLVALVYTVAMLRIDPIAILKDLRSPRHAVLAAVAVFGFLVVSPVAGFLIARALHLGPGFEAALVYTLAAPPIGSAAAMCLIIGFRGRVALELTILSALAMPFIGPAVTGALLGDALSLEPVTLGLRTGLMIFGGFAAAMIGRKLLGVERIERNGPVLDGVAALTFLLFILPLFDGAGPMILENPGLSLAFLALSALLVLGGVWAAMRLPGDEGKNGAAGVAWGTRAVSIYLAALPPDPIFTLFVALYQLPMAAIVMVFRRTPKKGNAGK